jgi:transposase
MRSRRRGQAYGQDLRDRVLAAVGEPIRVVAARFAVSASYVSKVRARLRATGETTPGPQHNHVSRRLGPLDDALRRRVAEQADATIAELRAWVAREHGVTVSHPVMWKTLVQLGLTLKKTAARGRARSSRHRRGPGGMVGARAEVRPDQAGVSG